MELIGQLVDKIAPNVESILGKELTLSGYAIPIYKDGKNILVIGDKEAKPTDTKQVVCYHYKNGETRVIQNNFSCDDSRQFLIPMRMVLFSVVDITKNPEWKLIRALSGNYKETGKWTVNISIASFENNPGFIIQSEWPEFAPSIQSSQLKILVLRYNYEIDLQILDPKILVDG